MNALHHTPRSTLDIGIVFALRTWAEALEIDLRSPTFSQRAQLGSLCRASYDRIPTTREWDWVAKPCGR